MLHEYDALYAAVRNKMEEEGKKDNLGHENAVEELASRLSTTNDDVEITQTNPPLFKLPTLNSGKVVDVTIRDFTEINLDLLKRHINAWQHLTNESGNKISDEVVEFAHSRIGKMSWKNNGAHSSILHHYAANIVQGVELMQVSHILYIGSLSCRKTQIWSYYNG